MRERSKQGSRVGNWLKRGVAASTLVATGGLALGACSEPPPKPFLPPAGVMFDAGTNNVYLKTCFEDPDGRIGTLFINPVQPANTAKSEMQFVFTQAGTGKKTAVSDDGRAQLKYSDLKLYGGVDTAWYDPHQDMRLDVNHNQQVDPEELGDERSVNCSIALPNTPQRDLTLAKNHATGQLENGVWIVNYFGNEKPMNVRGPFLPNTTLVEKQITTMPDGAQVEVQTVPVGPEAYPH